MTTAMADSTTFPLASVARHARRIKDLLRWGRSRATEKQQSPYVRQLAKDVLSRDRSKAVEQCVSLVVDLARRGTAEDAEQIGLALIAIARSEHAAVDEQGRKVELSVAEASIAEQQAQGDRENAEKARDLDPSVTNSLRFLAASATYARAARLLDEAVQRDLATRVDS